MIKARGRKHRVPPPQVVSQSVSSTSSASASGTTNAASAASQASAAAAQAELSNYTGWVCRPIASTGAKSQAYAFGEEDSNEISRNLYSTLETTLPGSKGVVNFCSRTVDLRGVGLCEIEFVFPRVLYAPWAPSLRELEQYAHGQELFDIVHPLFHWLWRKPVPIAPNSLSSNIFCFVLFCSFLCV